MKTVTYKGKILLKDKIVDGYISIEDGKISYIGKTKPCDDFTTIDGGIIAPGFIDIHCHTSPNYSAKDNPEEVARFHLSHGTTTMLLSYYRDIPHEQLLECLSRTKIAMNTEKNLYGAHLEGPYLNANLGFGTGTNDSPDKSKYSKYVKTGIVRQWTCAPEIVGIYDFIKDVTDYGIIVAIGHSAATYQQVKTAYDSGAKIVTHTFDATKAPPTQYGGTLEMDFNESCLLMDDMYYEVICDQKWIHLRKEKLALLIKTVGINKIVAITDMSCLDAIDDGLDVNIVDGQLSGTKLTMAKVATNLFNAGYNLYDVFKMVSLNPAKALKLNDRGEIDVGKKADLILIDEKANFKKLISLS